MSRCPYKIHPRRPYEDNKPDGYQESDNDYFANNRDAAVWLLDHEIERQQLKLFLRSRDINDRGGEVTLKIGTKLYAETEWPQSPFHVRGFVDDQVVVRWWSTSKQCWFYKVAYAHEFELGMWALKQRPKRKDQASQV